VIELRTRLEVGEDLTQPKTNSLGWSVSLSQAYLSVGALYYYAGEPVLSERRAPRDFFPTMLAEFGALFVKPAHAHPGHYLAGIAMGQMLDPTSVDLLAGPVYLATGGGVTGRANSATFSWQAPALGRLAAALDGHVIRIEGSATKDTMTLLFRARAQYRDLADTNDKAEVAGCAFGDPPGGVGVEMDANGTVTLKLLPSVWFDQVDFAYVAPGYTAAPTEDADGVVDLAGTLAWQGFVRGLKKGSGYVFSYAH
jgi:hypothetical protein